MAQIDSDIYLRNKGLDLGRVMDSYQEGVKLKDIADQRQKQKSIEDAYKAGVVQNPDGTFKQDRGVTLSKIAEFDPKAAMEQEAKWKTSDYEDLTRKRDEVGKFAGFVANVRDQVFKDPSSYSTVLNQAKSMGYDVSMMPQQYGPDAQKMIESYYNNAIGAQKQIENEFRQKELDSRAADRKDAKEERRYLFGVGRQDKLDAKAEKLQDREDQLAVPGFKRTGEVLPRTEEAQKFRKATSVSEQLSSKLNRLKQLVKEKGSYEFGGTGGTEMESLATEIQLLGKSPELYELGVLAGPDLSLLEKITADPASMNSLFTRDSSRLKQIDTQLKSISQKLDSTAKSLGYKKQGTGEIEMLDMVDSKGGKYKVPANQKGEAISSGLSMAVKGG